MYKQYYQNNNSKLFSEVIIMNGIKMRFCLFPLTHKSNPIYQLTIVLLLIGISATFFLIGLFALDRHTAATTANQNALVYKLQLDAGRAKLYVLMQDPDIAGPLCSDWKPKKLRIKKQTTN